jgi:RNA polymerase sigma-70 factor (ECF subfamily)
MHAEAASSPDSETSTPAGPPPAAVLAEILQSIPRLQRLARLWTRDEESSADLLQDTIERGLRRAASYRRGSNAGAWLRSIMYHLAVDATRRQRREGRLRDYYRPREDELKVPPLDEGELPAPEPVAGLADVRQAALRLREPLRGTFLLWLNERLSYQEISRRQRIPSNTVATRLMRARRQVRRITARHVPAPSCPGLPVMSG